MYISCYAVASSVINTTSMIVNATIIMDLFSVIVTCKINPSSTAEYCEVFARNDDVDRSSKLLCDYNLTTYAHTYVRMYLCNL